MQLRDIAKAYLQKRLFGTGPIDDFSAIDQFTGPSKDIKMLGKYSGVAWRCITTISEAMGGEYEPYFFTKNADGKKTTVAQHPLLDVLNAPNPDLTAFQLYEGSSTFVELFGEFFWYMVPGKISGQPKEIYLLRPDKVAIVLDKQTGEVIGYKYAAGTGQTSIPFAVDELAHYMTFNPKNAYRGMGTVEASIDYIDTEMEVSRFTRNYFRNNAAMSGVLEVNGKVSREAWNKFVRQWRERYAGVDNAGKVALVRESQVKFTPIGSNISDMQLTDLKQTTVDQILMMFRIPKGMFGMESDEGLGRASVETLEYIFAKWNLNTKMKRYDDFLKRLLNLYYNKSPLLVEHQNIIPADKVFELSVYNQGVDRWLTRKEIRDKDPELQNNIIDGADQLFVLNTQLPIDDAMSSEQAASKSPVFGTPPTPDDTPADGGGDPDDDEDADKNVKVVLTKAKKKDLDPENFRLALQSKASSYANKYKTAFGTVLTKQKMTVLSNLGHMGKQISFSKALSDDLMNSGDEDNSFQQALLPVLSELVKEQGKLALQFSKSDQEYKFSQSLLSALMASTKKMSQNFDATTLAQLNDELTEGIAAGEGFDELSNRVAQVYDQAASWRTDRVARTETQNASNSATVDAYQQNPTVIAMEWFANPGACEFCDELDGTQIGLEDTFVAQGDSVDVTDDDGNQSSYQADYGDVKNPPLHPNCECTVLPVTANG